MHPVISIISIYNAGYSRSLRVLDFYIRILFPFFFSFLKIYTEQNPKFADLKNKRDIRITAKNPNDLKFNLNILNLNCLIK